MSATKWTPGPWVWRYDNWLVGADGESVLEASDNGASYGMHSCVISHHYDPAVAAANKRLIAEAPAMAEALRELLGPDHEPNIGWYGTTASDPKTMFQCEFCRNEHEDAVLLEHDASCPVLLARQLLARLEGRE